MNRNDEIVNRAIVRIATALERLVTLVEDEAGVEAEKRVWDDPDRTPDFFTEKEVPVDRAGRPMFDANGDKIPIEDRVMPDE